MSVVRPSELAPGTYNVCMSGTHTNGATLQLTSQVTVGAGVFTSIGANIPVIRQTSVDMSVNLAVILTQRDTL